MCEKQAQNENRRRRWDVKIAVGRSWKLETELRESGEKERKQVERYTSPCPCKVLRAVEAAAKNVSAQPSHAA